MGSRLRRYHPSLGRDRLAVLRRSDGSGLFLERLGNGTQRRLGSWSRPALQLWADLPLGREELAAVIHRSQTSGRNLGDQTQRRLGIGRIFRKRGGRNPASFRWSPMVRGARAGRAPDDARDLGDLLE